MYCPRCSAPNVDDAKFCRGCGLGLETVSLALSGKYPAGKSGDDEDDEPRTWLEKRRKGVNKLVRATGLLGSSLLIGAALGLFGPHDWIVIWMVFCGWMATWGVFSLVSAVQLLLESRFMKADLETVRANPELWSNTEQQRFSGGTPISSLPAPGSVTEHTTRALSKQPGTEGSE